jgi:hypothetical protein
MSAHRNEADRLGERLRDRGIDPQAAKIIAQFAAFAGSQQTDRDHLESRAVELWLLAKALADAETKRKSWVAWPSPEAWYERSVAAMKECQPLQWQALMFLWAGAPHLNGMMPLPENPEELGTEHFVPWAALGRYLRQIADDRPASGEPEVLQYLNAEGQTEAMVIYSRADEGDAGAHHAQLAVLHMVRKLALQVAARTGLRADQAVAFLLCDEGIMPPRISLAPGQDDDRGASLSLHLVSPEVTVDELRHAYRSYLNYLKTLGGGERPNASGYRGYLDSRHSEAMAGPSDRTLLADTRSLVAFVGSRRQQGRPWREIYDEWNRDHPDRVAARVQSLQANFYQARRRLKLEPWIAGEEQEDE